MKRTVEIEREICDRCKNKEAWTHCKGCNKVFCFDCKKIVGREYPHGLYVGGSDDGFYCLECIKQLISEHDPLFEAYEEITSIRNEVEGFNKRIEEKRKRAEENLQKLLKKQ